MTYLTLALIATALLAYAMFSRLLRHRSLTAPLAFVIFGYFASKYGVIQIELEQHVFEVLMEVTLALILFTDAARIDVKRLAMEYNIPARMLIIGLPLTIAAGTGAAILLFPEFTVWEAALLAAVLAPTDAALGQAVQAETRVPPRIRQSLNAESGLNDGLALPIVLILAAFAANPDEAAQGAGAWLGFGATQIGVGALMGAAVGLIGGIIVEISVRGKWMTESFRDLTVVGLALIAFALANYFDGNGYIATFVAGIFLGAVAHSACRHLIPFGEAEGQLLSLITFIIFGAILLPLALQDINWTYVIYATLSLTVVRMIPIAFSLWGTKMHVSTRLFLGWFGPRGLASILFALLVVGLSEINAREEIMAITALTVTLSIFAHGITAAPFARWYGAHIEKLRQHGDRPEHTHVKEMPTRFHVSQNKNGDTQV
jgi:NhaP-type Na+/H+ or K+/H+ antiporter